MEYFNYSSSKQVHYELQKHLGSHIEYRLGFLPFLHLCAVIRQKQNMPINEGRQRTSMLKSQNIGIKLHRSKFEAIKTTAGLSLLI
jgi:hypothetical protein